MSKIDELVNRFLTWPVPADVHPDGTPGQPGRIGTNLLTAAQAKQMLEHILGDASPHEAQQLPTPFSEALARSAEREQCAVECEQIAAAQRAAHLGGFAMADYCAKRIRVQGIGKPDNDANNLPESVTWVPPQPRSWRKKYERH